MYSLLHVNVHWSITIYVDTTNIHIHVQPFTCKCSLVHYYLCRYYKYTCTAFQKIHYYTDTIHVWIFAVLIFGSYFPSVKFYPFWSCELNMHFFTCAMYNCSFCHRCQKIWHMNYVVQVSLPNRAPETQWLTRLSVVSSKTIQLVLRLTSQADRSETLH